MATIYKTRQGWVEDPPRKRAKRLYGQFEAGIMIGDKISSE